MQLIYVNAAALAVAVLFYSWRTYYEVHTRKLSVLHRRVAYMLWTMAGHVDSRQESLSPNGPSLTAG